MQISIVNFLNNNAILSTNEEEIALFQIIQDGGAQDGGKIIQFRFLNI